MTFNITFCYDGNVLSTVNTLKSVLNFNFKRVYYVTYENFISTSNYPTYVIEGNTLNVSFGTLDAPIEAKKSGTILRASQYTYSNYMLTLNNVDGDIHIRKLTKYQITNLVKNGSFESGITNWTIVGSSSKWHQTSIAHFGTKAYYRDASEAYNNYLKQVLSFTNGHKYYFFAYTICTSEQSFFADIYLKGGDLNIKSIPTSYRKASNIYTSNFTGTNPIHINFAKTTDSVIIDGIGMVDLTSAFGSGNEPDLTWCNANINYFDNTTIVYK